MLFIIAALVFLTNPAEKREFKMESNKLSEIDVDFIAEQIAQAENLPDGSLLCVNGDNFDLLLTADFALEGDGVIRYFYEKEQKTYSAQLRLFQSENKYFLTDSDQWPEQMVKYKLVNYLEALKYLPQEEIRALSPDADGYAVWLEANGVPDDFTRVITYDKNGANPIDGWFIQLRLEPLHQENGAYNGDGNEVIHLFYGGNANSLERAIHQEIMDYNDGRYLAGDIRCEKHLLLSSETQEGESDQLKTITVYSLVLYQEYDVLDSDLQLVSGGCVPTVLSFGIKEEGEYILQEYWEPRGGSYYAAYSR